MGSRKGWLVGIMLGLLATPAWAGPDVGLHRCVNMSFISDTSTTADTFTSLSSTPAIVCSVDFRANQNTAWFELFDAASGVETDTNVRVVSESGEATSGNGKSLFFGDNGRLTVWGLQARVKDGTLVVHWSN